MDTNMTRTDQRILFTALAFVAVLMRGGASNSKKDTQKIRQLADSIGAFCREETGEPGPATEETDRIIERHIEDLKEREETRLPEDRDTLVRLHDRLQQRKARRAQRAFYASAGEAKLADEVLSLLDEEIADDEALT
jgi:hypothetical protein